MTMKSLSKKNKPDANLTQQIADLVKQSVLPTPTTRDWKGMSANEWKRMRGEEPEIDFPSLPGVVAKQCGDVEDGMHSRLNPLFVEEMMGFPHWWTIYPFLRQNGEPKP